MQRTFSIFLVALFLLTGFQFANAQGCSDAGFCTMGAMRPDQAYSKRLDLKLRSFEMNFYRDTSLLTPIIYVATIDATIGINDRNYLQVKVPYQYSEGTLGQVGGIGDLSISFISVLKNTRKYTLNGTLGGKYPWEMVMKL